MTLGKSTKSRVLSSWKLISKSLNLMLISKEIKRSVWNKARPTFSLNTHFSFFCRAHFRFCQQLALDEINFNVSLGHNFSFCLRKCLYWPYAYFFFIQLSILPLYIEGNLQNLLGNALYLDINLEVPVDYDIICNYFLKTQKKIWKSLLHLIGGAYL